MKVGTSTMWTGDQTILIGPYNDFVQPATSDVEIVKASLFYSHLGKIWLLYIGVITHRILLIL